METAYQLGEKNLQDILRKYTSADIPINLKCNIIKDLGIDSLDWTTLILDIEAEYNFEFPDDVFFDEDLTDLFTLKNTVEQLLEKQS